MAVSLDPIINRRYQNFFISILFVLLFGIGLLLTLQIFNISFSKNGDDIRDSLSTPSRWPEKSASQMLNIIKTEQNCHYYNCLDIYRCGRAVHQKLSVYIYPLTRYVDDDSVEIKPFSKEFLEILESIANSEFYTPIAEDACIFIPSIDLLNENELQKEKIAQILGSLPHWQNGSNHLLFNFLPGTPPQFETTLGIERGKAIVAGGGFSSLTYRRSFDISLPIYNPMYDTVVGSDKSIDARKWLIISSQVNIHQDYRDDIEHQTSKGLHNILILDRCFPHQNFTKRCRGKEVFDYPHILEDAKFCLVIRGGRLGQVALHDVLKMGCIPIIFADSYVLPFSEVIDWRKISIHLYEEELADVVSIIKKNVSTKRMREMQKQVRWIYQQYFSSMGKIAITTLKILNDRIFPMDSYHREWNNRPIPNAVHNPLFLPITAPKDEGFTAVILAYDRIGPLFQMIDRMSHVPSLTKIIVVWNNQRKKPPISSSWPKIDIPLKIIETKENKLSNRFYPYNEITTQCILAIDDDINMLTIDELEFGFQAWREFPDRIIGFPSRNVVWNNLTNDWKYDSEWTNEISMVLTGAAFYHKYWSYVYTTDMPAAIRKWVDDHMNCEDIAMNFLVSNRTGKAPIKVTPRKKFKCRECSSGDISTNEAHLTERSECVKYFSKVFGQMTLKSVEFRADPVLFKDKISDKLKLYTDIGSL